MKNFVFVVNKYRRCINGQKYHSIFGENQNLNHFYTYTNSLRASASPFHAGYLSPCFHTYMYCDLISLIVCTVILQMTTTLILLQGANILILHPLPSLSLTINHLNPWLTGSQMGIVRPKMHQKSNYQSFLIK